ncbi:hypothetical protein ONZ45_g19322 [Pleurotus djamor]|nr:hypothetical protein ONZ45_g19322 [Pleurotus djamor]
MGDYDRIGTPYNYILAGSPCLVANLWDVTDRDIDKFSQEVFDRLKLNSVSIKAWDGRNPQATSVVKAVAGAREVSIMSSVPSTPSDGPEKSDELIILSDDSDDDASLLGYANHLTPPANTMFWRRKSFLVMKKQETEDEKKQPREGKSKLLILTWRADAYVYLTNALPDEHFEENGGEVYVVIVHRGAAEYAHSHVWGMTFNLVFHYTVTLKSEDDGSAETQLPSMGSPSGDSATYPIEFDQDMQMFNNGGAELFTFKASYHDALTFKPGTGKAYGLVDGLGTAKWSAEPDIEICPIVRPLKALSVFRINTPGLYKFEVYEHNRDRLSICSTEDNMKLYDVYTLLLYAYARRTLSSLYGHAANNFNFWTFLIPSLKFNSSDKYIEQPW